MPKKENDARMTIDISYDKHKVLKHIATDKKISLRQLVLEAIDKRFFTTSNEDASQSQQNQP